MNIMCRNTTTVYSLTTDKRREGAESHETNVQNVTTLNQDLTPRAKRAGVYMM